MIAKIIGHGDSRAEAHARLLAALDKTVLAGPRTNLDFLHRLAERSARDGEGLSTRFIERHLESFTSSAPDETAIRAGVLALLARAQDEIEALRRRSSNEPAGPWAAGDGFEYTGKRILAYDVLADGEPWRIPIIWGAAGAQPATGKAPAAAEVLAAGDDVIVWHQRRQTAVRWPERKSGGGDAGTGDGSLRARMPGRLAKVMVRPGDEVSRGDRLAIVEAMKMEHVLHAPSDAVVVSVPRSEGEQVEMGAVIAELKARQG
jgi:3-methylcrotonyl-CoA carboxylase alpha subunit